MESKKKVYKNLSIEDIIELLKEFHDFDSEYLISKFKVTRSDLGYPILEITRVLNDK